MAGCIENLVDSIPDWSKFTSNLTEQIQEIEVLKSYYENTDILEVIEEASQIENKKFSLQLRIPIETKQTPIKVEIWLPIEQVDFNSIKELDQNESKKPQLIRSISGKQAHTIINCKKLIPIQIDVILPDVYPSDSKPIFTISAEWLNKAQLSQLSVKLNQIWEENETMPILFTWCQWITENLVEFLDIFEPPNMIIVTPLNNGEFDAGQDNTIQSLFLSADNFIVNLLRYFF